MTSLIGLALVVLGFALRLNPLLVVALAGLAAGLGAGRPPLEVVAAFGRAFNANRYVSAIWLVLPVVGLLERRGLQARAAGLMARLRRASAGRVLLAYLALRQVTAALGLAALGGHAAMVRPLIAPMAEAAAERDGRPLEPQARERIRANAAAADNVGAFFGEDIFVAFGSLLLIRAVMAGMGVEVSLLRLSLWAIPTAVLAFGAHALSLWRLDRALGRRPA